MAVTHLAITNFLAPAITTQVPVLPMELDCTALAYCDDGALLALLYLPAHDVVRHIPDDRLVSRIAALKQRSDWAYLIIGGELQEHNGKTVCAGEPTRWNWHAVQGALLSVQEIGCAVITIPGEHDLGPTIERLGNRDRSIKRTKPQRLAQEWTLDEAVLLALPHIGEHTMFNLLNDCGSALWALIALCDPASTVPGIGAKTKQAVRDALGLRPDEILTTINLTDTIVPAKKAQVAA